MPDSEHVKLMVEIVEESETDWTMKAKALSSPTGEAHFCVLKEFAPPDAFVGGTFIAQFVIENNKTWYDLGAECKNAIVCRWNSCTAMMIRSCQPTH